MASRKISALTAATSVGPSDLFPIVQDGSNKRATLAQILEVTNAGSNAVARNLGDKMNTLRCAEDYSSHANADALNQRMLVLQGGTSSLFATQFDGPYVGLLGHQITDVGGNKRAPWFSAVKAAPTSYGTPGNIDQAFNGDLSRVQIAMEHRITNAGTLGAPTAGNYQQNPETAAIFGSFYNNSGANLATDNADGRTGASMVQIRAFQAGQGDAGAITLAGFTQSSKPGATHFLANPATFLLNGGNTAGVAGCYLNTIEFNHTDAGFDVAAIGAVLNFRRTNTTGALGCTWMGIRVQSKNLWIDAAYSATGAMRMGLDLSGAILEADRAAVVVPTNGRIYLGASQNDPSPNLYNFPATAVLGGAWMRYASGTASLDLAVSDAVIASVTSAGMTVTGGVVQSPPSSVTLASNGQVAIEFTNATTLTFRGRSGGTTRSATMTLS